MNHPHVLEVLDAFAYKGHVYIVTELASSTLEEAVEFQISWPELDVVRAGLQLSSALHYLHQHARPNSPLVHRDVTTKNVFYFQDEDTFKLGDFGITKVLGTPTSVATTQVANWGFVAPKLIRLGYTTPQSDLYQLGLVLYAMTKGQHAVDQSLPQADRIDAIANGVPYKEARALTCRADLKKVILKLLLRRQDRRYSTAQEVFVDLQPIRRKLLTA